MTATVHWLHADQAPSSTAPPAGIDAEFDTDLAPEVDHQRIALARALNASLITLHDANAALGALTSPGPAYDVDYVHGADGADVAAFLAEARRAIRAAYTIAYRIVN